MWQIQALMALDLARERADEARAWRRAASFRDGQPSLLRRATAGSLRAIHAFASGVANSAGTLAERVEPSA